MLWLFLLCVVCAHAAEVDYATKLQQTLGSASIAYKCGDFIVYILLSSSV